MQNFRVPKKTRLLSLPPLRSSQVFNGTVAGIVDGTVGGFNGTVLCVGRRGSGTPIENIAGDTCCNVRVGHMFCLLRSMTTRRFFDNLEQC